MNSSDAQSSAPLGLGENEIQSTIGDGGSRVWLYPRETKGKFTQRRTVLAYFLLAVYLGIPWLRWNHEAVFRVDIFERKLILFGNYFFPQDIRLFLPGIFSFVLTVFLITATWGRIWCGWACPQTVFLQFLFAPIERWVEGRASQRQKRDNTPGTWDWFWRKGLKHFLFLLMASLIANTALAYFFGTGPVLYAISHSPSENWTAFLTITFFTAVFYWVFAYFKEQACVIVCPYARFQSVLLDDKTKVVAYDVRRGEPRGRGAKRNELGDCVDCKQCVVVCPTGIDIRKGNQLECIGCTRCIDACDRTMEAWKKPTGLIRYASLHDLERLPKSKKRVRPIVYGSLAAIMALACVYLIITRPLASIDVMRSGNQPYFHIGADSILNTFTLHIRNKDNHRQVLSIRFDEPIAGTQSWEGRSFTVGTGELKSFPFAVVVAKNEFHFGKREIALRLKGDGVDRRFQVTLVGPFEN